MTHPKTVVFTTRPVRELDFLEFKELISNKKIEVSPHAYDHLSTMQRKVFKEEELLYAVKIETPRKVYLQENGRYAVYFRRKEGYRKIVLYEEPETIKIISYMDCKELPRVNL